MTDPDAPWFKPAVRAFGIALNGILITTFFIVVIGLITHAAADPGVLSVILAVCSPAIAVAAMVAMKLLLRTGLLLLAGVLGLLLAPCVAIFTNPFDD